ncbi:MAG TPA: hypothetical protein VFF37_07130 [Streptomyces sp.]|nr:hypothetical protein [Streptomyces sp.]
MSNATTARTAHASAPVGPTLMAGHDGVGNAVVATAAMRAIPAAPPVTAPKT